MRLRIVRYFGWRFRAVDPGRSQQGPSELFCGNLKCLRIVRVRRARLSVNHKLRDEPVAAPDYSLQILRLRRIVP